MAWLSLMVGGSSSSGCCERSSCGEVGETGEAGEDNTAVGDESSGREGSSTTGSAMPKNFDVIVIESGADREGATPAKHG